MAIPKDYNAEQYEDNIYKKWEDSGAFQPSDAKETYSIAMPPPNATGHLHLGHATMLAIEDILIRYKRMQGFASLWVPGTDHASIATQNKVEKIIADEGVTRHDLGRDAFIKRVEEYVAGSQDVIRGQVRKMGSSCDWTREGYTLDPNLSEAVQDVFIKMHEDEIIYRGNRIVNWCPRCASTLADDEVEYKEVKEKFYYIQYGDYTIGTSRPETKFADKYLFVHPDDERYQDAIGTEFEVDWLNGPVTAKLLADPVVEMEFGTGCMTITPAHDFTDFELAQKYDLEILQIIDEEGKMTDVAGKYEGMPVRECREKLVEEMQEKGLITKIDEDYVHNLSVCYRCDTPIEPLISKQWFIDVNKEVVEWEGKKKSLKQIALDVVRNGDIRIIPDKFEKTYFNWMENLRDWCVSRQIWFGHRIPVWYRKDEVKTSKESPGDDWKQDPDTLDTWFSSGMWTFTTLGWPGDSEDFKRFHPTSVLETGYDILFFWIARMILMTTYATGEIPFKDVYLHGLVRDKQGRKMSKSLGNGIDPLDMIAKYGTDAVRLSLVIATSPGNDFKLYEDKIASYRNFVTKVWNSARYALMNIEGELSALKPDDVKSPVDKWIITRTQEVIDSVTQSIENYRLSEAGTEIYNFLWNEYANWYLEISKNEKNQQVLGHVIKQILIMLHPFTPFVTEILWGEMGEDEMLINAEWPKSNKKLVFEKESKDTERMISAIQAIRSLKASFGLSTSKDIAFSIVDKSGDEFLEDHAELIHKMGRTESLTFLTKDEEFEQCAVKIIDGDTKVYIHLGGKIDLDAEKEKIQKELDNLNGFIKGLRNQLANKSFVDGAPKEVVKKKKDQEADTVKKIEELTNRLNSLG